MGRKDDDFEYVWVEVSAGRQRRVRVGETVGGDGQAAFFFQGDDLSIADRKSLELLLGVPVHDRAEAKRVMEEKGLRFVEPGERNAKARRELREWAAEAPDKRGPMPEEFKQRRQVPRLNIMDIYRKVREGRR